MRSQITRAAAWAATAALLVAPGLLSGCSSSGRTGVATTATADGATNSASGSTAPTDPATGSASPTGSATGTAAWTGDPMSASPSGSGTASATGRAGRLLTTAEAAAALPTLKDMPVGWAVDPDKTFAKTEDKEKAQGSLRPLVCDRIGHTPAAATHATKAAGESGVSYLGSKIGPIAGGVVESYPTLTPKIMIPAIRSALPKCRSVTGQGMKPGSGHMVLLALPRYGDDSVGVRLTASTSAGVPVTQDAVFITTGHNVIKIGQLHLGKGTPTTTELTRLADLVMQRLNA